MKNTRTEVCYWGHEGGCGDKLQCSFCERWDVDNELEQIKEKAKRLSQRLDEGECDSDDLISFVQELAKEKKT